jgi:hypothetical protein
MLIISSQFFSNKIQRDALTHQPGLFLFIFLLFGTQPNFTHPESYQTHFSFLGPEKAGAGQPSLKVYYYQQGGSRLKYQQDQIITVLNFYHLSCNNFLSKVFFCSSSMFELQPCSVSIFSQAGLLIGPAEAGQESYPCPAS